MVHDADFTSRPAIDRILTLMTVRSIRGKIIGFSACQDGLCLSAIVVICAATFTETSPRGSFGRSRRTGI